MGRQEMGQWQEATRGHGLAGAVGDRGEHGGPRRRAHGFVPGKTVMPSMTLVWADAGYAGRLVTWVAEHAG
ncbi:hypothetical protein R4P64_33320 [Rhodococcus sp. IEGM 1366]|nr:hypothetical protein [Rhodococcus sp. IEGM 1366]MDV8071395.1 hypothetical protein [Rhodococcus sp. IEGM 1366]